MVNVSRESKKGFAEAHTMLPCQQCLFSEQGMCVATGGHDNKLDVGIGKEVVRGAMMACIRVVDGAMRARLSSACWCLCTLQDSGDLEVRDGGDKGDVEALGGVAVPHDADFDGGHDDG